MLVLLIKAMKHGAIRQLPAGQAFAQFLGNAWTRLQERGERILGYLVNHGTGERGEFAIQRLTGQQAEFTEIVSRRQSGDLDLAAVFLDRSDQNAVTYDAQGFQ